MSGNRTIVSALERNWEMVIYAVSDVDEATMAIRPNEDSNSISWLIWHMARVTDRLIHMRLQDVPQLWSKDGWHEKFNMPDEPDDMGMGWSSKRVSDWQAPSKEILMDYFNAANNAAASYIASIPESDMDRAIPWTAPTQTMPLEEALAILLWDNIVHGGQVAYLRGYFQGMGWHR
ncbi:MAG: DinB family protein [Chloroflexi bacterium]|nr:DinB family protein [Chloroflexota bacterium]